MAEKPEGPVSEKRRDGGGLRPWEAAGMSRASWYRHGKPQSKPERHMDQDVAKLFGISVRTVQRARNAERREMREAWREAMREAGFEGPFTRERIYGWLGQHPEVKPVLDACTERCRREMLDKLERGAIYRDWRKVADMTAAHPSVTRWLLITRDGSPAEIASFTTARALDWITELNEK